jgi:GAF domain-containing protein
MAGANDHLTKEHLGRLVPAVRRELRDAEARAAHRQEEENEMAAQLEGMNALQQSLLTPYPLETRLTTITSGIVKYFNADSCRIWMLRPGDLCQRGCVHSEADEGLCVSCMQDKCLHLVASSGCDTHNDDKGHRRVPFGFQTIGRIASGDEHRVLIQDAGNAPRDRACQLELVSFAGYQLRVPRGNPIGVLALFSKRPILPSEDAMLGELGNVVARAIQQAAEEEAL